MAKQTKPQELLDAVRELPEKLPIFPEPTPLVLKDETAALPADDGRIEYTVTATAPPRVAGRRVKPGDTLRLTEEEARGELLALHIAPPRAAGLTAEQVAAVTEIL
ncbi:hypothetical protein [Shinella zoogloeoides]|uniref:Uncharacterized protein n=1 Tax=Shinella zoogloeoides TaxID=352475 RepID=A0A6N8TKD3_SHIZO|nr:hypothetical protein [Shinella zoogloeoides]MXO01580.1 hypothetical protein [Shinella zoogloeoides]UEX80182.1 hypothetical protein K8M09_11135 [Shinella zoogloeoides]